MTDQFSRARRHAAEAAGISFDCPSRRSLDLLTANDFEAELLELNRWVDWLRHTYGLAASSAYWHRTNSRELSACTCTGVRYDPEQNGSRRSAGTATSPTPAPGFAIGWLPAALGSIGPPTRQTSWPVKTPQPIEDHRSRIATRTSCGS